MRPRPTGTELFHEVWKEVHDWPVQSSEEVYDILDDAARRDMSRGLDKWNDTSDQSAAVVFGLEALVLDLVMEEIAREVTMVEKRRRAKRLAMSFTGGGGGAAGSGAGGASPVITGLGGGSSSSSSGSSIPLIPGGMRSGRYKEHVLLPTMSDGSSATSPLLGPSGSSSSSSMSTSASAPSLPMKGMRWLGRRLI